MNAKDLTIDFINYVFALILIVFCVFYYLPAEYPAACRGDECGRQIINPAYGGVNNRLAASGYRAACGAVIHFLAGEHFANFISILRSLAIIAVFTTFLLFLTPCALGAGG